MKTAEQWFKDEYGESHLGTVVELKDYVSLHSLMQEYGNYLANACMDQVLKDAWDNVQGMQFTQDELKQSILNTEKKLL